MDGDCRLRYLPFDHIGKRPFADWYGARKARVTLVAIAHGVRARSVAVTVGQHGATREFAILSVIVRLAGAGLALERPRSATVARRLRAMVPRPRRFAYARTLDAHAVFASAETELNVASIAGPSLLTKALAALADRMVPAIGIASLRRTMSTFVVPFVARASHSTVRRVGTHTVARAIVGTRLYVARETVPAVDALASRDRVLVSTPAHTVAGTSGRTSTQRFALRT